MKKLITIIAVMGCLFAKAQITTKYLSCDTVELKAPYSAVGYQWDTGQTTRVIKLTNTNQIQTIGVLCGNRYYMIYEPVLPALPETLNVIVQYIGGQSAYIIDLDYNGMWDIKYLDNGMPLNNSNALQWQVFSTGIYTVKETINGCVRKRKIKVVL